MAILTKGTTYSTGDNPTAATLNALVDSAAFVSGATDGSTTQLSGGSIIVKDGGVTPAKLSTGHPAWTAGGTLSSTAIDSTPIGGATPSTVAATTLSATSTTTIYETIEKATVSASGLTGTVQFNWLDGAAVLYTTNAAANWVLNLRGNSGTTLNASIATADAITFMLAVPQGTTAYYPTSLTIDSGAQTVKWLGGTAPSAGNASSTDVYVYTVIKTASATFTVLASQTKFA